MAKILVVYYSRTGHVQNLAAKIATGSGAELESIHCHTSYKGFFGCWRAGWGAMTKRPANINPAKNMPADYDLVAIGTPVWVGTMPPPVRRYLIDLGSQLKRLAVFCTQGGSGSESLCAEIEALCNKVAVAKLIVTDKELRSGETEDQIAQFVSEISNESCSI